MSATHTYFEMDWVNERKIDETKILMKQKLFKFSYIFASNLGGFSSSFMRVALMICVLLQVIQE